MAEYLTERNGPLMMKLSSFIMFSGLSHTKFGVPNLGGAIEPLNVTFYCKIKPQNLKSFKVKRFCVL